MTLGNGLRRLRVALRTHGPVTLCAIAWDALLRSGPTGMVRLLSKDQPFLSVARVSAPKRAPSWPPALDPAGALPAPLWRRWLQARPSLPGEAAAPHTPIAFVLAEGADDAQRQRICAIAPDAAIVESSAFEPDPAWLYLFLRPGDEPHPDLPRRARALLRGERQVLTFDTAHRQDGRIALLLAPGANAPFLAEDARHYHRGAATGAFVRATEGADLRARLAAWTGARPPAEVRATWLHLAEPLAETAVPMTPPIHPPGPAAKVGRAGRSGTSVVICTRDKGHLMRQLARQLLRLGEDVVAEIVILANHSANPYALQTLADLSLDPRVLVVRRDEPFNFSRLCNAGVAASRGAGPLLFLNDDIAPIAEDWLERLMARLDQRGTGAVGPLLLYPDERVQHAGMHLRLPGGAGHILRGALLPAGDPLGLTSAAREVSCLTGAALLVDRAAFHQVGGFDEDLALAFQDVDLCLKLHRAGLRNVFEPRSVLLHMESVSLGATPTDPDVLLQKHRERVLTAQRWTPDFPVDPFLPGMLDPGDESGLRLQG